MDTYNPEYELNHKIEALLKDYVETTGNLIIGVKGYYHSAEDFKIQIGVTSNEKDR